MGPRRNHRIAIVTVLAGTLAVSHAAHAQSSHDEASARSLFLDGLEAFDRGEIDTALRSLRASYAIRARPVVMLNIGQALRAQGHLVEAIDAFREYLRVGGASLPRNRIEIVQQTIDYLVAQTATVSVTSDPSGATVRFDGRDIGHTPTTNELRVTAGEHVFEVEQPGYVLVRERITLQRGSQRTLNFRLAGVQTAGTLAVRVANAPPPVGLRVAIDGVEIGAPPLERTLAQGGHQVRVTAPGFDGFRAELVLGIRQHRDLAIRLDRSRPFVQQPWLWTTVGVVVVGAVAGIVLGTTLGRDPDQPNAPTIHVPAP